jgi:hypothetical protein
MRFEIDYEPGDEEVVITLDNASLLKATFGDKNTLILNDKFKELSDEDYDLYNTLRKITLLLLELQ